MWEDERKDHGAIYKNENPHFVEWCVCERERECVCVYLEIAIYNLLHGFTCFNSMSQRGNALVCYRRLGSSSFIQLVIVIRPSKSVSP